MNGDGVVQNVSVTARRSLANALPPALGSSKRSISGTVLETSDSGPRPLEGWFVGWDSGDRVNDQAVVAAWTFTDAAGRFFLCGLPRAELVLLVNNGTARRATTQRLDAVQDSAVTIEIP